MIASADRVIQISTDSMNLFNSYHATTSTEIRQQLKFHHKSIHESVNNNLATQLSNAMQVKLEVESMIQLMRVFHLTRCLRTPRTRSEGLWLEQCEYNYSAQYAMPICAWPVDSSQIGIASVARPSSLH